MLAIYNIIIYTIYLNVFLLTQSNNNILISKIFSKNYTIINTIITMIFLWNKL